MANNYSRWYGVGSAGVTQGSKTVTGKGTYWLAAGLHAGDMFSVDSVKEYEVDTVTDDTHLTLKTAYTGSTLGETTYRIIRNFTATTGAQIAAQTADLLNDFRKYIDADMQTIHGESAYEIARRNGFTGTEKEWLESLIGAGQWQTLDARTDVLDFGGALLHNSVQRGKGLGVPTAEHWEAIASGKFTGLYAGDYWTIDGTIWRIVHFNYHVGASGFGMASKVNHVCVVPQKYIRDMGITAEDNFYFTTDPETWTSYEASNWFQVLKPKFDELVDGIFGEHVCTFPVPKMTINANTCVSSHSYSQITGQRSAIPSLMQRFGLEDFSGVSYRLRGQISNGRGRFAAADMMPGICKDTIGKYGSTIAGVVVHNHPYPVIIFPRPLANKDYEPYGNSITPYIVLG